LVPGGASFSHPFAKMVAADHSRRIFVIRVTHIRDGASACSRFQIATINQGGGLGCQLAANSGGRRSTRPGICLRASRVNALMTSRQPRWPPLSTSQNHGGNHGRFIPVKPVRASVPTTLRGVPRRVAAMVGQLAAAGSTGVPSLTGRGRHANGLRTDWAPRHASREPRAATLGVSGRRLVVDLRLPPAPPEWSRKDGGPSRLHREGPPWN
jgi:hypothetical protein